MRIGAFIFALACVAGCCACARTNAGTVALTTSHVSNRVATNPTADPAKAPGKVDFQTQIRPVLQAKCQPCHFSGGQVYQRMPFDRPETIKTLGTKLFTRIKDENERRLIREFLAQ
jgi:hypothetical protein